MQVTEDYWLDEAIRMPISGGNEMDTRRFLIIHDTCGWSGLSSIEGWMEADDGICAHIVIERDGTIFQCRPFNRTCGHCGDSEWVDPNTGEHYYDINYCSIGIELANSANMARSPDVYPDYNMGELAGEPVPRLVAKPKYGGPEQDWEVHTEAQLAACEAVSKVLVERFNLDDLVGHQDIAPDRKVDPSPACDLDALRLACGFTKPLPNTSC